MKTPLTRGSPQWLRRWVQLEATGQDAEKMLGGPAPTESELRAFRKELELDQPHPDYSFRKMDVNQAKVYHDKHGYLGRIYASGLWMAIADRRTRNTPPPRQFDELQHALDWLKMLAVPPKPVGGR